MVPENIFGQTRKECAVIQKQKGREDECLRKTEDEGGAPDKKQEDDHPFLLEGQG